MFDWIFNIFSQMSHNTMGFCSIRLTWATLKHSTPALVHRTVVSARNDTTNLQSVLPNQWSEIIILPPAFLKGRINSSVLHTDCVQFCWVENTTKNCQKQNKMPSIFLQIKGFWNITFLVDNNQRGTTGACYLYSILALPWRRRYNSLLACQQIFFSWHKFIY